MQVALNSDLLKQSFSQLWNLRDLEAIILDLLSVLLSELARHLEQANTIQAYKLFTCLILLFPLSLQSSDYPGSVYGLHSSIRALMMDRGPLLPDPTLL